METGFLQGARWDMDLGPGLGASARWQGGRGWQRSGGKDGSCWGGGAGGPDGSGGGVGEQMAVAGSSGGGIGAGVQDGRQAGARSGGKWAVRCQIGAAIVRLGWDTVGKMVG